MKKLALLTIFLILLLPFCASASSTALDNVKVIDQNGTVVKGAIIKTTHSSNSSSSEASSSNSSLSSLSTTTELPNTWMNASQTVIEKSGKNLFFWVGDSFLKGGFELSSVGVKEENITKAQTPKYTLYSKTIDPFKVPIVWTFILLCLVFHVAVVIFFIFIGIALYNLQQFSPKEVSKIRAGFSGEESYFDIKEYLIMCGTVLISPLIDAFGIWFTILNRNAIVSFLTTKTADVLGAASDNLPTYLLVNIAWYANNLEKVFGEYTIYLMVSFIIIKSWIMAAILIFGSLKQAAIFHFSIMIGFILVVLMDIFTLGFVSFGINLSVRWSNWGYTLAGMVTAALFNFLILLGILYAVKRLIFYPIKQRTGGY